MDQKVWSLIQDAIEKVRTTDGVHRIEGDAHSPSCKWKVYRVSGGIVRVDIQQEGD